MGGWARSSVSAENPSGFLTDIPNPCPQATLLWTLLCYTDSLCFLQVLRERKEREDQQESDRRDREGLQVRNTATPFMVRRRSNVWVLLDSG